MFTKEAKKAGGKKSANKLYKCQVCGLISKIGGITSHCRSSKHYIYTQYDSSKNLTNPLESAILDADNNIMKGVNGN